MKKYGLGIRFYKYRNLCCILVGAVVLCFYFIYNYLFSNMISWWNDTLMAVVFILIGAAFIALIFWGADKIQKNVYYVLTESTLLSKSWSHSEEYPYQNFRRVYYGIVTLTSELPIVFELENGCKIHLNPYIDELPELTGKLLKQVKPYAEIDPKVLAHIDSLM